MRRLPIVSARGGLGGVVRVGSVLAAAVDMGAGIIAPMVLDGAGLIALMGRALTMRALGERADAVVLDGARIERVVDRGARVDGVARTLDFGERTILPGFVDAHCHVAETCLAFASMVDCRAPICETIDDVLSALSDGLANAGDDWLVGQANLFFDRKLADGRLPDRDDLDRVSRDVPIAVRFGGHRSGLNSKGLEVSGLLERPGSGDRSGALGVVEVDGGGRATGIVAEVDAELGLPLPGEDAYAEAIAEHVERLWTSQGVTAIGEITDTVDAMRLIDRLSADGRLAPLIRFYVQTLTMPEEQIYAWREHLPLVSPEDRVRVQGLKLFADGGYTSFGAMTREPYVGGRVGRLAYEHDALAERLRATRAAGLQLAVHTNGEGSQDQLCEVFEAEGTSAGPMPRLEHAGNLVTSPQTTAMWRRGGRFRQVPQPPFVYGLGDFLPAYVGPPAEHGRFPFRTLVDEGWELAGSSDNALGSDPGQSSPMFGVWCAVARRGFGGEQLEPEQAITVDEALMMYTRHAAAALEEDGRRGTLEPGKVADVVVLDRDVHTVAADDLKDVRVDYVVVDGAVVYERPAAVAPAEVAA